jgi:hypothetical protein
MSKNLSKRRRSNLIHLSFHKMEHTSKEELNPTVMIHVAARPKNVFQAKAG